MIGNLENKTEKIKSCLQRFEQFENLYILSNSLYNLYNFVNRKWKKPEFIKQKL